jgi:hypothetical protein
VTMLTQKAIDEYYKILQKNEERYSGYALKSIEKNNTVSMMTMNAQAAGWTGARCAFDMILEKYGDKQCHS